jgi:ATP-binding cassette subfamily F protein 3
LLDEAKRQREAIKEANASPKAAAKVAAPVPVAAAAKASSTAPTPGARALKRQLDEIDTRMAALQSESTTLEARLCTPLPPLELAELGKRLKAVSAELEALEEQWLQLSEALAA